MKTIIHENERGFLFKNGVFQRMLLPGKHRTLPFTGQKIKVIQADGLVNLEEIDYKILMRDSAFANSVTVIDVPDSCIAVWYEDGHIVNTLESGSYCFWSVRYKQSFKLLDMTEPEITGLDRNTLMALPSDVYTSIVVPTGFCALLYYFENFERMLESGTYYFWNNPVNVNFTLIDKRIQQLSIPGQEILTADKVSLRINFVCNFRITDVFRIVTDIDSYHSQLYTLTQLILREYIGKYRLDEILEQKENIAGFVLEKLREKQGELYVEFTGSGLKDIILPGEIRDIMNTVLIAEKKAQANVIARREEVASTRSLLNTAKLMEENTTLYKLKELEYLEKICDKVGNITVGGGNLLEQLAKIV